MAELTQVHAPVNTAGKPRFVFIHGLDGDFRTTWMSKRKDDSTLWPKWVGEDTGCPVWLLGYGAAMSRWKADAMASPRQATAVLQCLSTEPELMEGPLVLVGHSLGGLVIKAALHQGIGRDVERHERLARNIKGIAFVGTPHFGSTLASIAAYSRFMRPNPQVGDLRMDDANLEDPPGQPPRQPDGLGLGKHAGLDGVKLAGDADVPMCASMCLVTDAPDRLRKALDGIRRAVGTDPLVPASAKQFAASAPLAQLVRTPGTRAVVLRELAVISFSAYLYYCPKAAFDQLPQRGRLERLFVAPLLHRLSKKSEHIEQVHTHLADMPQYLEQAAAGVEQAYRRRPTMPRIGTSKYAVLEELASVVAAASCAHLGDLADGSAAELFESLRTRLRFAENVATGEKHKRDENPLP